MAEYEITYAFDVRRVLRVKIEAGTDEEAVALAKKEANDRITAELLGFINTTGWCEASALGVTLFVDADGGERVIAEEELGDDLEEISA